MFHITVCGRRKFPTIPALHLSLYTHTFISKRLLVDSFTRVFRLATLLDRVTWWPISVLSVLLLEDVRKKRKKLTKSKALETSLALADAPAVLYDSALDESSPERTPLVSRYFRPASHRTSTVFWPCGQVVVSKSGLGPNFPVFVWNSPKKIIALRMVPLHVLLVSCLSSCLFFFGNGSVPHHFLGFFRTSLLHILKTVNLTLHFKHNLAAHWVCLPTSPQPLHLFSLERWRGIMRETDTHLSVRAFVVS